MKSRPLVGLGITFGSTSSALSGRAAPNKSIMKRPNPPPEPSQSISQPGIARHLAMDDLYTIQATQCPIRGLLDSSQRFPAPPKDQLSACSSMPAIHKSITPYPTQSQRTRRTLITPERESNSQEMLSSTQETIDVPDNKGEMMERRKRRRSTKEDALQLEQRDARRSASRIIAAQHQHDTTKAGKEKERISQQVDQVEATGGRQRKRTNKYAEASEDSQVQSLEGDDEDDSELSPTPEYLKHPDDFLDEDAIDSDYKPSSAAEDRDSDKPSQNNQVQYSSPQSSPSESGQGTIPILETICIYMHEVHEGTCRIVCTNYDPQIRKEFLPGTLANSTVYSMTLKMSPHGFPVIAITIDGHVCGWVPPEETGRLLLERLLQTYHRISAKVKWHYGSKVPGHGYQYVGSTNWLAACDEGDGLDSFYMDRSLNEGSEISEITLQSHRSRMTPPTIREETSPVTRMFRDEEGSRV
ncbi:hypothetical protein BJ508DRAFT_335542 [Ascobolus immersus RN42]|uniref:Uncharacterized protein n=1 Tax=Ascobolus immersus RN42 TaxID=1160509 RepID=A0A3N4HC32_ASCIM|nr:hypothetical protein BJ508DRAFT_335542 [Ascobolus immersus RN42]